MAKALLLGGTGSLATTAEMLAATGWDVTVTARHPERVPDRWGDRGITCVAVANDEAGAVENLVWDADLVVDGLCYEPDDARRLARWSQDRLVAMVSSAAVYVDAAGNHQNSDEPARWAGPIAEGTPTMPYRGEPARSRLGYGAAKAECERILLAEAEVPLILRPGKIHGPGMRNPREWHVVRRVLDGRPVPVRPAGHGESTTSAELVADAVLAHLVVPATRILNVADADAPTPQDRVRRLAALVDPGAEVVEVGEDAPEPVGRMPWSSARVLDTRALRELGPSPRPYVEAVRPAVAWLREMAQRGDGGWRLPAWLEENLFEQPPSYDAERAYLSR